MKDLAVASRLATLHALEDDAMHAPTVSLPPNDPVALAIGSALPEKTAGVRFGNETIVDALRQHHCATGRMKVTRSITPAQFIAAAPSRINAPAEAFSYPGASGVG